jgi:hypothetical protein
LTGHLYAEAGWGGAGWLEVVRRGGSMAGIGWRGGGDGADVWGRCVNGRREIRRVGEKAQLKRESVNR